MASASTVTKEGCVYTITHRIHFAIDRTLDPARARQHVANIKRVLRVVWADREHKFGPGQRCTLRIRFDYRDAPGDDVDTKVLMGGTGRACQSSLGPEQTFGEWFVESRTSWGARTAAHEAGHELGMDDKYEDDANGYAKPDPTVPGYSRNGIAFNCAYGVPQPLDYEEILRAHGIHCDCPPDEETPHAAPPPELEPGPKVPPPPATGTAPTPSSQWPETHGGPSPFQPRPTSGDDGGGFGEELDGTELRPIVLVPGIMGSMLAQQAADGTLTTIWPVDKIGADLRPLEPTRAKVATGLYPGSYDDLVTFITTDAPHGLGRTLGRDFWIFAYDWTRPNLESATALSTQIDAWLTRLNAQRAAAGMAAWDAVDVICHSMGGLVTRAAWRLSAKIRRVAFIATPHYGAPYMYFCLHHDTPYYAELAGYFMMKAYRFGWKHFRAEPNAQNESLDEALWEICVDMMSAYELMPDDTYLDTTAVLFTQPGNVPVYGVNETYFDPIVGFPRRGFENATVADQRAKVSRAMQFKRWLGDGMPTEHLNIYSVSEDTVSRIEHWGARGGFTSPYAGPVIPNGDNRVTRKSGIGPASNTLEMRGNHASLPNDHLVHRRIREFLR